MIVGTGVVLGAFVLGSFGSNPPQISAGGIPGAPAGVSAVLAEAQIVNATSIPPTGGCTASNLGTFALPTVLVSGASTGLCLSHSVTGFAASDTMYVLEVAWGTAAANATIFQVQVGISVLPAANDLVVSSYLKTSTTITSTETAIFAVDLTQSGDTSLVQYDVLVTEL
ncbi:MAG: hypothetical protein ACLQC7_07055 [Thermoplasmata archaeon]